MVEIIVSDAESLPELAYLSLRVGAVSRQCRFSPGCRFRFEGEAPETVVLDVFDKVGTAEVKLQDLAKIGQGSGLQKGNVNVPLTSGASSSLTLQVAALDGRGHDLMDASERSEPTSDKFAATAKEVAQKARSYLDAFAVQKLLQGMVQHLLKAQPQDPVEFMCSYLQEARNELTVARDAGDSAGIAGSMCNQDSGLGIQDEAEADVSDAGSEEPIGFAVDGSEPLPDLSAHHSLMAEVLTASPELYENLRHIRTTAGVTLAKCIKTGVDNMGHAIIRTPGLMAGDATCFEVFRDVFSPVLRSWHEQHRDGAVHPHDMDISKVASQKIDSTGRYVHSVFVHGIRNLDSFPFSNACTWQERRHVEHLLQTAASSMKGDLEGIYLPLQGSGSCLEQPDGMSVSDEAKLDAEDFLFEQPDSMMLVQAGFERHWPDARGVFRSHSGSLALWINELDHVQILSHARSDLQDAFERFARAERALGEALVQEGHNFSWCNHLGFLSPSLTHLGTGMKVGARLHIPLLSTHPSFHSFCTSLGVRACRQCAKKHGGTWEVSRDEHIGTTEIQEVSKVVDACRLMVHFESKLEQGVEVQLDVAELEKIGTSHSMSQSAPTGKPSLAPSRREEPGKSQSRQDSKSGCHRTTTSRPPSKDRQSRENVFADELPDLSQHHNLLADALRADPAIFQKLKALSTPLGTTFAKCIKTGLANPGIAQVKSDGIVAGDPESYDVFRECFDAVLAVKHPYIDVAGVRHASDLDPAKVRETQIDSQGKHVLGVRIEARRNIAGMRMSPTCSEEERREIEQLLSSALSSLASRVSSDASMVGKYHRLQDIPGEQQAELRRDRLLFEAPDSKEDLDAGFGRHWPDARGIFLGDERRLVAWINEEDHLRLAAMAEGQDLKGMFSRTCSALTNVEEVLKQSKHKFAFDDRLGYIGTCPANVGSCLTVRVLLHLPLLNQRPEFAGLCERLLVQSSPDCSFCGMAQWQGNAVAISNLQRLGHTEPKQVNTVIDACKYFVHLELRLSQGEQVDFEAELANQAAVNLSDLPGLGDSDVPGFSAEDVPEEMPDLSKHFSIMASTLAESPPIYSTLRGVKTSTGVSLARCIKPGIDNRGHPAIKMVGLVAGDAECYQAFHAVFAPVARALHGPLPEKLPCRSSIADVANLDCGPLDPTSKRVVSVQLRAQRNLAGFRLTPAISRDERRRAEAVISDAIGKLIGDFAGVYCPLAGSKSHAKNVGGMNKTDEARLNKLDLLFREPDSALVLSSGCGRHWPDARGVFSSRGEFAAWINDEDHLRLWLRHPSADLRSALRSFLEVDSAIQAALREAGQDYSWNDQFGFITTCPSNLGTALVAEVRISLPQLGQEQGFKKLCQRLGMSISGIDDSEDWNLVSYSRLGRSEVEQVGDMVRGVRELVHLEEKLQLGQVLDLSSIALDN